jgi:hypothetical protein
MPHPVFNVCIVGEQPSGINQEQSEAREKQKPLKNTRPPMAKN